MSIRPDRPPYFLTGSGMKDERLITVERGSSKGCFASTEYKGTTYCVPEEASTTKKTFSVLHTLVNLLTTPTSGSQTQTVRTLPGG
jgi:hypothetical protein